MSSPAPSEYVVGPPAGATPDVLGLLVGQAMDDIDAGRLDVETALGIVAEIAWRHGNDHGHHG